MTDTQERIITHWRHANCNTYDGAVVSFNAPPDEVDDVKKVLARVEGIQLPMTRSAEINHDLNLFTRFDITQHDYAASGQYGYIEMLEVLNGPSNHGRFFVHHFNIHDGHMSWEFGSVKNARSAMIAYLSTFEPTPTVLASCNGFVAEHSCDFLRPWYYACGNELIIDEFAFPDKFHADPFYSAGRVFEVKTKSGVELLQCIGARVLMPSENPGYTSNGDIARRRIFWNDGSYTDVGDRAADYYGIFVPNE